MRGSCCATIHFRFAAMKGAVGAAILRRCDVDPEDPDTLIVIDGGMAFRNSDAAIAICGKGEILPR